MGGDDPRYRIAVKRAPLETLPAKFKFFEGEEMIRYGRAPFETGCGGDPYWTACAITQIWYMSETGKIPVTGAGYGGEFSGNDFDSIWLDMSEIVRPTRDGIHGREYISTSVCLGRKNSQLEFDGEGKLLSDSPTNIELPIPIIFEPLPMETEGLGATLSVLSAAKRLGSVALVRQEEWKNEFSEYAESMGLIISQKPYSDDIAPLRKMKYSEFEGKDALGLIEFVKKEHPEMVCAVRVDAGKGTKEEILELAKNGAEAVHIVYDMYGKDEEGKHIKESLSEVHDALIDEGLRDGISIIASGGISSAEYVPKSIICGADAVGIDYVLMVSFGCALWADLTYPCSAEHKEIDAEWGENRICNLMAGWRNQIIEVMGAMGLREIRRMRGERGRAMWIEEEEKKFSKLFEKAEKGFPKSKVVPEKVMGDMRWPFDLLRAGFEMARTGEPPKEVENHKRGVSGGGFDRLAFRFEKEGELSGDDGEIDLSVSLNKRNDGRPELKIPYPVYGGGMSYGSISLNVMLARAMAWSDIGSFMSTGEGGYPSALVPYSKSIITQVATGLFGVNEETIMRAPIVEFKYAQGAKPGLGGHLLAGKVTETVAKIREAVAGSALYSPFPFHSVYSVEDHKKHVDWIKETSPKALVNVKVSTPTDVDMVAVGSYYAGAHMINIDGSHGGTGAAPEISKKNIALPIEYAIPKVHKFLEEEGVRDEVTLVASGGIRNAWDVAKAIALGADVAMVGTADIVAMGCERLGQCEKDKGCPLGITTTDPKMSALINSEWARRRIVNMHNAWARELRMILKKLGMKSIRELRGRTDVLVYLESGKNE